MNEEEMKELRLYPLDIVLSIIHMTASIKMNAQELYEEFFDKDLHILKKNYKKTKIKQLVALLREGCDLQKRDIERFMMSFNELEKELNKGKNNE